MMIQTQEIVLNEARDVRLTVMVQDMGVTFEETEGRPAILILPGGGYAFCSNEEAEAVAYPYLNAGYQAFILRYSVGEHKLWPNPLDDYEQTMELIRSRASEWRINTAKIAVIGFSAGGHLASCAATMAKHRPAAAILGYAALDRRIACACQPGTDIPGPIDHVDNKTCPCFLFAARDDTLVPMQGILAFEQALNRYEIQFESHIYAYGGHGFGNGRPNITNGLLCSRAPRWVEDSITWLGDVLGVLTAGGMQAPACPANITGNKEDTLSVRCTVGHLQAQGETICQLFAQPLAAANMIATQIFGGSELCEAVTKGVQLRDMLKLSGMSDEDVAKLNEQLRQIPNHVSMPEEQPT